MASEGNLIERPAMRYRLVECQTWVRSGTHSVIRGHHPEFRRLRAARCGRVVRLLRVWCEAGDGLPGDSYLGACVCTPARFGADVRRVLRRAGALAATTGEPARSLRSRLARALRRAVA